MKNKLFYLTKFSLKKKLGSKWFLFINLFLVLIIIGLVNIDKIISMFGGDFNNPTKIIVKDETGLAFDVFKSSLTSFVQYIPNESRLFIEDTNKHVEDVKKDIDSNKKIIIVIKKDSLNTIRANMISKTSIEPLVYQVIVASLNSTKVALAMAESNIDPAVLTSINKSIEIKTEYIDVNKKVNDENINTIMAFVAPVIILPFFFLLTYLVQMIGAEISEEKTTKGMEIIISNVSPKVHLISKILAGNIFVLLQAIILLLAGGIGLLIRKITGSSLLIKLPDGIDFSKILDMIQASDFYDKLIYVIPLALLLIVLSFIAYSLLAGILASMTTSMEDYQQLQAPLMIFLVFGYYLAMLSPTFEGSTFIRVVSYMPFISGLVSPVLLVIGEITVWDILFSTVLLIGTVMVLIKYGLRVYKVGILNYSTTQLWTKMFKAVKTRG